MAGKDNSTAGPPRYLSRSAA